MFSWSVKVCFRSESLDAYDLPHLAPSPPLPSASHRYTFPVALAAARRMHCCIDFLSACSAPQPGTWHGKMVVALASIVQGWCGVGAGLVRGWSRALRKASLWPIMYD